MANEKDAAEVIQTIARSIQVSQRGARRVRAHRFKELFGYQALTAQRRARVEQLMAEAGIVVTPSLAEAGRDDWLAMSMPVQVEVPEAHPDPRPLDHGQPLVLVECKRMIKDLKAAAGQVRSYALWALPAYYVITDARTVSVWDFQGAIAPDIEVLTLQQAELAERFDDLYAPAEPAGRSSGPPQQARSPRDSPVARPRSARQQVVITPVYGSHVPATRRIAIKP